MLVTRHHADKYRCLTHVPTPAIFKGLVKVVQHLFDLPSRNRYFTEIKFIAKPLLAEPARSCG